MGKKNRRRKGKQIPLQSQITKENTEAEESSTSQSNNNNNNNSNNNNNNNHNNNNNNHNSRNVNHKRNSSTASNDNYNGRNYHDDDLSSSTNSETEFKSENVNYEEKYDYLKERLGVWKPAYEQAAHRKVLKTQFPNRRFPFDSQNRILYFPLHCKHGWKKEANCPIGVKCFYAHTFQEKAYHPACYKTKPCNRENKCFDATCSYYHEEQDSRLHIAKLYRASPKAAVPNDPTSKSVDFNLKTFKVFPCVSNSCQRDVCLNFHSDTDRRRDPRKFQYSSALCRNLFQQNNAIEGASCPDGENCKFSHNKFESLYHDDVYRGVYCKYEEKCRRGKTCAFAHNSSEITVKIFSEDDYTNPDKREQFFLTMYKVIKCPYQYLSHHTSADWTTCPYHHTTVDTRRNPAIGYKAERCNDPLCHQNSNCEYCHNKIELNYHCELYKTQKCQNYQQDPSLCTYGVFCSYIHDPSEERIPTTFAEQFSRPYEHEEIDDIVDSNDISINNNNNLQVENVINNNENNTSTAVEAHGMNAMNNNHNNYVTDANSQMQTRPNYTQPQSNQYNPPMRANWDARGDHFNMRPNMPLNFHTMGMNNFGGDYGGYQFMSSLENLMGHDDDMGLRRSTSRLPALVTNASGERNPLAYSQPQLPKQFFPGDASIVPLPHNIPLPTINSTSNISTLQFKVDNDKMLEILLHDILSTCHYDWAVIPINLPGNILTKQRYHICKEVKNKLQFPVNWEEVGRNKFGNYFSQYNKPSIILTHPKEWINSNTELPQNLLLIAFDRAEFYSALEDIRFAPNTNVLSILLYSEEQMQIEQQSNNPKPPPALLTKADINFEKFRAPLLSVQEMDIFECLLPSQFPKSSLNENQKISKISIPQILKSMNAFATKLSSASGSYSIIDSYPAELKKVISCNNCIFELHSNEENRALIKQRSEEKSAKENVSNSVYFLTSHKLSQHSFEAGSKSVTSASFEGKITKDYGISKITKPCAVRVFSPLNDILPTFKEALPALDELKSISNTNVAPIFSIVPRENSLFVSTEMNWCTLTDVIKGTSIDNLSLLKRDANLPMLIYDAPRAGNNSSWNKKTTHIACWICKQPFLYRKAAFVCNSNMKPTCNHAYHEECLRSELTRNIKFSCFCSKIWKLSDSVENTSPFSSPYSSTSSPFSSLRSSGDAINLENKSNEDSNDNGDANPFPYLPSKSSDTGNNNNSNHIQKQQEAPSFILNSKDKNVIYIMSNILNGICNLHKLDVTHGALTADNVMFSSEGKFLGTAKLGSFCPTYNAVNNINYNINSANDIYSCGLLLFDFIVKGKQGTTTTTSPSSNTTATATTIPNVDIIEHDLPEAHHLLSNMLTADPSQRPSAIQCLSHIFFWDDGVRLSLCEAAYQFMTQHSTDMNWGYEHLHKIIQRGAKRLNKHANLSQLKRNITWQSLIPLEILQGLQKDYRYDDTFLSLLLAVNNLKKLINEGRGSSIGLFLNTQRELEQFLLSIFPNLFIELFLSIQHENFLLDWLLHSNFNSVSKLIANIISFESNSYYNSSNNNNISNPNNNNNNINGNEELMYNNININNATADNSSNNLNESNLLKYLNPSYNNSSANNNNNIKSNENVNANKNNINSSNNDHSNSNNLNFSFKYK